MLQIVRFRALQVNPNRIDVSAATREVETYVKRFLDDLVDMAKIYPPPRADSKYVRTGNLGSSWQVNVSRTQSGIDGRIVNYATDPRGRRYMTYVQGIWQTYMHQSTGWININTEAGRVRQQYRNDLQAIYKKYIRTGP